MSLQTGEMAKTVVIGKEWRTLDEAVESLGKSPKTIERLVNAELLRSRLEHREGRKSQRLYHAGDLERIKEEGLRAPASEPKPETALAVAKPVELAIPTQAVAAFRELAAEWADRPERVALRDKLWLTVKEAGVYSGLSRAFVVRMAKAGKFITCKAPGLRIKRASLEAFEG